MNFLSPNDTTAVRLVEEFYQWMVAEMAYWLVNTVRYQLKQEGIHSCWREIVCTMNTQKAVITLAQNNHEEMIMIRRCSEPNQPVGKLYGALKYKYAPFVKRKYVVHKSELENYQFIGKQEFRPD